MELVSLGVDRPLINEGLIHSSIWWRLLIDLWWFVLVSHKVVATHRYYLNPFLQTAQKKDGETIFLVFFRSASCIFLHCQPWVLNINSFGFSVGLIWTTIKQWKILAWRQFIRLLLLLKTASFLLAAFPATESQGRDVKCKQAIFKTCLHKKMKDSASDLRCQGVFIFWKMSKYEEVGAV